MDLCFEGRRGWAISIVLFGPRPLEELWVGSSWSSTDGWTTIFIQAFHFAVFLSPTAQPYKQPMDLGAQRSAKPFSKSLVAFQEQPNMLSFAVAKVVVQTKLCCGIYVVVWSYVVSGARRSGPPPNMCLKICGLLHVDSCRKSVPCFRNMHMKLHRKSPMRLAYDYYEASAVCIPPQISFLSSKLTITCSWNINHHMKELHES